MAARWRRWRPDDLAARVIEGIFEAAPRVDIDEVVMGCANQAGEDNRNVARMAVLLTRLKDRVPAFTVNRLCASGLDAVVAGARIIRDGGAEAVIAGGVESMSRAPYVMAKAETAFQRGAQLYDTTIGWRFVHQRIAADYGVEAMPETAENLATERGISASTRTHSRSGRSPFRCRLARGRHPAGHGGAGAAG